VVRIELWIGGEAKETEVEIKKFSGREIGLSAGIFGNGTDPGCLVTFIKEVVVIGIEESRLGGEEIE